MSLDPRLELQGSVDDPLTERYQAQFAGKAADVWVATASTPMVVRAQMAALARADLPRVLRSPYLGRVLHGGTNEEGMPYLVIESVEAVTLQERMVDGPAFKVPDAIRMVVDLLGGIAALSKLGLHHGAVEPNHIRVIDASRGSTLRLFRLGANARGARTGQIDPAQIDPDEVACAAALAYAAPEQARGDLGSDVSADAYSTVAVLYALLGGHLPFGGGSAEEVLSEAAYGSPRSLGELRPELAGALSETIDRALASDVTARFDSIAELQRALRGALLKSPGLRTLETVVGDRAGIVVRPPARHSSVPGAPSPVEPEPRPSDDEFGLEGAFDETFGAEEPPDGPPDDRLDFDEAFAGQEDAPPDDGWLEDDAPLELKGAVETPAESKVAEDESTRVGQVSSEVLAALESGEFAEPDYSDYPDYADDEEDEPTRVGAVNRDLLAQTIRDDAEASLDPGTEPPEEHARPITDDLETPIPLASPVSPAREPDPDPQQDAGPEQAAAHAEAPEPAEPMDLAPSAPVASRLSERPAGALPTAPGAPSALSTPSEPDDTPQAPSDTKEGGSGWIWMLVGALVLAAAVAAGMLYGR